MKKISAAAYMLILVGCATQKQGFTVAPCEGQIKTAPVNSRANEITSAMEKLILSGIPGCALSIYSDEGWWSTSVGYAKIEDLTAMENCHLHYLQSIAKTYMATAILQLSEQGKIELDAAMTVYLPRQYSQFVSDADKITIRMLLNHTSGIPEYNIVPLYVSRLLQQPGFVFLPEDYLKYIDGKPLDFAPGSKYAYRNTNYVILALVADAVTGDHARFISEHIFKPLGLQHTYYRSDPGYLSYSNLYNSYWDRYSNGVLENISQLQRNNVAALIGDDGIVATPEDAVKFLIGLMEGKILSEETLAEMKTWVRDKEGKPVYGLGLTRAEFNGQTAFGHSGGGIGAGCQLYYFPDKKLYMFIGINLGTVTKSPIHEEAMETVDQIYRALLD